MPFTILATTTLSRHPCSMQKCALVSVQTFLQAGCKTEGQCAVRNVQQAPCFHLLAAPYLLPSFPSSCAETSSAKFAHCKLLHTDGRRGGATAPLFLPRWRSPPSSAAPSDLKPPHPLSLTSAFSLSNFKTFQFCFEGSSALSITVAICLGQLVAIVCTFPGPGGTSCSPGQYPPQQR